MHCSPVFFSVQKEIGKKMHVSYKFAIFPQKIMSEQAKVKRAKAIIHALALRIPSNTYILVEYRLDYYGMKGKIIH